MRHSQGFSIFGPLVGLNFKFCSFLGGVVFGMRGAPFVNVNSIPDAYIS